MIEVEGLLAKGLNIYIFVLGFMSEAQLDILQQPRMEAACEFPSSFPRTEALNFKSPTFHPIFLAKTLSIQTVVPQ